MAWHVSKIFTLFYIVQQCCSAYPLDWNNAGGAEEVWGPVVASLALLLACAVLALLGCVCCRHNKTPSFQEFTDTTSNHSLSTAGFVNPLAGVATPASASTEFTIFPPPGVPLVTPPAAPPTVHFEPLPDIRPRPVVTTVEVEVEPVPPPLRPPAHSNAPPAPAPSELLDGPSFPRDRLKYLRELGTGWFGKVVEGEAIVDGNGFTPVVVRILREDAPGPDQALFLREVSHLRALTHPNLLHLLGSCCEAEPLLTIMELCPQGDLKSFLVLQSAEASSLGQQGEVIRMLCEITAGLEHMAQAGFVHTDLAARNCLLTSDLTVKIGDYGTSIERFREDYYCAGDVALPIRWCAPDTLVCTDLTIETKEVTSVANVWTLGVVMWEILEFGRLPHSELSDDEVIMQVLGPSKRQLPAPSLGLPHSQYLYHLMRLCWSSEPDRPTVGQIHAMLRHLLGSKGPGNEDFEQRWAVLRPNKATSLVLEACGGPSALQDFSPSPSLPEKDFLSPHKSPSLQNLHGSLEDLHPRSSSLPTSTENLSSASPSFHKQQEVKIEDIKIEIEEINEPSCSYVNEKVNVFSSHNSNDSSLEDEDARKICEAIQDLDDALALEKTSSSESSSNQSTPKRKHSSNAMSENTVLDFRLQQVASDSDEEECWRGRVERGEFTEKVRQKSKSVQDLMVLTHIDSSSEHSSDDADVPPPRPLASEAFKSEGNICGAVVVEGLLDSFRQLKKLSKIEDLGFEGINDFSLQPSISNNINDKLDFNLASVYNNDSIPDSQESHNNEFLSSDLSKYLISQENEIVSLSDVQLETEIEEPILMKSSVTSNTQEPLIFEPFIDPSTEKENFNSDDNTLTQIENDVGNKFLLNLDDTQVDSSSQSCSVTASPDDSQLTVLINAGSESAEPAASSIEDLTTVEERDVLPSMQNEDNMLDRDDITVSSVDNPCDDNMQSSIVEQVAMRNLTENEVTELANLLEEQEKYELADILEEVAMLRKSPDVIEFIDDILEEAVFKAHLLSKNLEVDTSAESTTFLEETMYTDASDRIEVISNKGETETIKETCIDSKPLKVDGRESTQIPEKLQDPSRQTIDINLIESETNMFKQSSEQSSTTFDLIRSDSDNLEQSTQQAVNSAVMDLLKSDSDNFKEKVVNSTVIDLIKSDSGDLKQPYEQATNSTVIDLIKDIIITQDLVEHTPDVTENCLAVENNNKTLEKSCNAGDCNDWQPSVEKNANHLLQLPQDVPKTKVNHVVSGKEPLSMIAFEPTHPKHHRKIREVAKDFQFSTLQCHKIVSSETVGMIAFDPSAISNSQYQSRDVLQPIVEPVKLLLSDIPTLEKPQLTAVETPNSKVSQAEPVMLKVERKLVESAVENVEIKEPELSTIAFEYVPNKPVESINEALILDADDICLSDAKVNGVFLAVAASPPITESEIKETIIVDKKEIYIPKRLEQLCEEALILDEKESPVPKILEELNIEARMLDVDSTNLAEEIYKENQAFDTLISDLDNESTIDNISKEITPSENHLFRDRTDSWNSSDMKNKRLGELEGLKCGIEELTKRITPDDERSSDSGFRDKGSLSESCDEAGDKYNLEDIEVELETFGQLGTPSSDSGLERTPHDDLKSFDTSGQGEEDEGDEFWKQQMASLQHAAGKTLALFQEAAGPDLSPCDEERVYANSWFRTSQEENETSPKSSSSTGSGTANYGDRDSSYVSFGLDDECVAAIRSELEQKLPKLDRQDSDGELADGEGEEELKREDITIHYNIYPAPLSPILEEQESLPTSENCSPIQSRASFFLNTERAGISNETRSLSSSGSSSPEASPKHSPHQSSPQQSSPPKETSPHQTSPLKISPQNTMTSPRARSEQFEADIRAALEQCVANESVQDEEEGEDDDDDVLFVNTETNEATLVESPLRPKLPYLAFVNGQQVYSVTPENEDHQQWVEDDENAEAAWRIEQSAAQSYMDQFDAVTSFSEPDPEEVSTESALWMSVPSTRAPMPSPEEEQAHRVGDPPACNTPDWESDTASEGSSSSGEFVWKEGDREAQVTAVSEHHQEEEEEADPQQPSTPAKPFESFSDFPMAVIHEEDEDDGGSTSSSGTEFIPSSWNSEAAPSRSSLRSPDKKSDPKKNVSFKRQKYHCVYEYPREASDTELDENAAEARRQWSLAQPNIDYASYADWEMLEDELTEAADQDTDPDSSEHTKPEPFDFYKLNNIECDFSNGMSEDGEFFISSSARPFHLSPSFSSQFFPGNISAEAAPASPGGSCSSSSATPPSPLSPSSAMGELRHTRDKLKLDLSKFSLAPLTPKTPPPTAVTPPSESITDESHA